MRVKLLLSYDGTDFGGWQKQKSGKPTVQGEVEKALSHLLQQQISVVGSGRTDAGVHAMGQVAHFEIDKDISRYNLVRALNSFTPPAIVVKGAWQAPEDFHAIASASEKTYKYLIWNNELPSSFRRNFTTWVRWPMSVDKLNELCGPIIGEHDFKSFQTGGTEVTSTTRQIKMAQWRRLEPSLIEFTITGSGFLKQMVRNIVGAQLDLHHSNGSHLQMSHILQQKDRTQALGTAPPQGLYLYQVKYPSRLDNKCRKL